MKSGTTREVAPSLAWKKGTSYVPAILFDPPVHKQNYHQNEAEISALFSLLIDRPASHRRKNEILKIESKAKFRAPSVLVISWRNTLFIPQWSYNAKFLKNFQCWFLFCFKLHVHVLAYY